MERIYHEDDIKNSLKVIFHIETKNVKYVGSGYDSEAYLVNNDFIFKFAKHKAAFEDYLKEKKILDFLKNNWKSNVKLPQIEYFYQSSEIAIMGYKVIRGEFFSQKIYRKMKEGQKENLAQDIAKFLKGLHQLNVEPILEFTRDDREEYLKDWQILKSEIYDKLSENQIDFMEKVYEKILNNDKIFYGRKCLCHNDLSCNHIILDENYQLAGIIDFGDSSITNEYCDFLYLLEDDDEEIERDFGLKVSKYYGLKEVNTVLQYADLKAEYYPIETLVCGIKNDSKELCNQGLKLIEKQIK